MEALSGVHSKQRSAISLVADSLAFPTLPNLSVHVSHRETFRLDFVVETTTNRPLIISDKTCHYLEVVKLLGFPHQNNRFPAGQSKEPAWKSMFSLYAHTGKDFTFPADSLLHDRAISNRVQVEWGQFSVVSSAGTACTLLVAGRQ